MRPAIVCALMTLALALPASAAPDPKKSGPENDAADIADKLTERIDLDRVESMTLRTILDVLQDKLGYSILLDHKAILSAQGMDGDRKALEERTVSLPAMKRVRLETALREVLDQIDAEFFIETDHVRVSTALRKIDAMGPWRTLSELNPNLEQQDSQIEATLQIRRMATVTANFRDTPLMDALKTVSLRTGRSVAVNPDVGEKAKALVSISLANAPFETAVSILAEAAGLRAFRNGNAAVIVTPERAKRLEEPRGGLLGGSCSFGPGTTVSLEQLETIGRAKADADRQALEEKVRKLTAELESLKKK